MWFRKRKGSTKVNLLQVNTRKRVQLKHTPRWYRTEDIQGQAPNFNIRCFHCDMPMSLRHSVIEKPSWGLDADEENNLNIMSYKCSRCAWFIRFYVLDKERYLKKVIKKYRGGYRKFIPKGDDWSEEGREIRKQLSILGYWGGRID